MKNKEIILTREEAESLRLAINVGIHRFKELSEEYGGTFWKEREDMLRKILEKLKNRG